MARLLVLSIFMCIFTATFAQKTVKVEGEYIYRSGGDISIDNAKRIALERAQIETIANTFGTKINQYNSTKAINSGDKSDVEFLSLASSDVQGEWIETIGEPKYEISYEQDMLIVKCTVKGVVRELPASVVDLVAKVLRNGIEDRYESSEFKDGDDMYISFQSPVNGYLAIYLVDNEKNAFCLLPYRNQVEGIYDINANQRYVFFSEKSSQQEEKDVIDEYVLTCNGSEETNQIFLLFSTSKFSKANDLSVKEDLPRELSEKDFLSWLTKQRNQNKDIQVIKKILTIKNN